MKQIIILLSLVVWAGCSVLPDKDSNDIEAITVATQQAQNNIMTFTDREIERAKTELSNTVSSVVNKADTTLNKKIQQVESSLNAKAAETKRELNSKMSGIEESIAKAEAIGFVGIVIGLIGIIIATIAYRKRPRTDINAVKNIVLEEISSNDLIRAEIRSFINGQNTSSRSQIMAQSKDSVEHAIEAYLNSKKFKDIIQQYTNAYIAPDKKNEAETDGSTRSVHKATYQIFAKESNTMILSNIQDTYQKGKSIYRLTLHEPDASTAEVSICVEQEEVKQRILKFDSQYLEPICIVIRSSNAPTEVAIKSTGLAERNGDDWQVIKPITVELK